MAAMDQQFDEFSLMRRAIELAARGIGSVEPNPPVGAIIVDDERNILAEGFHEQFGGPHAEINALQITGNNADGSSMYVTLEPCCHHGKTGPCTEAILAAGIRRVVIGTRDPFPHVDGGGIAALKTAGVEVETGLLEDEAKSLIAPFTKHVKTGLPWVHAKWAMTLDGKIATRTGHSQWISSPESREIVHKLRGRMDAILVGANTAAVDDPMLTARPAGPRTATRIVVDSHAKLSLESQLVKTARTIPVLVVATEKADSHAIKQLQNHGVEVMKIPIPSGSDFPEMKALLTELGRRQMSHILVEGGGAVLGSFFDAELADEAHVFVSPKIVGGSNAVSAVTGEGKETVPQQPDLENPRFQQVGDDIYIHGRMKKVRD
jgi:diaminohydroxyphosphoribosylaminopyrimidine deaminase / 5-amino-6-(5-phosphoribosylamino)uracil reductase